MQCIDDYLENWLSDSQVIGRIVDAGSDGSFGGMGVNVCNRLSGIDALRQPSAEIGRCFNGAGITGVSGAAGLEADRLQCQL